MEFLALAAMAVEHWDISLTSALGAVATVGNRTKLGKGVVWYARRKALEHNYHRRHVPRKKARNKHWRPPQPDTRWGVPTAFGMRYIPIYKSSGKAASERRPRIVRNCLVDLSKRRNYEAQLATTWHLMQLLRYVAWRGHQDDLIDSEDRMVQGLMLNHRLGIHDDRDMALADLWLSDFPKMRLVYRLRHGSMIVQEYENHRELINLIWYDPQHDPYVRDVFINQIAPGRIEISRLPRLPKIITLPAELPEDNNVIMGVDMLDATVWRYDQSELPNIVAIGKTRFGKSEWMKAMIAQLLAKLGRGVESVIFCNPTNSPGFKQYMREGFVLCNTAEEIKAIVRAGLVDMAERNKRANKKHLEISDEPDIWFFFDEFSNIRDPETIKMIEDLCRNGLKMRIHVVVANQRGTREDGVPRGLRDNTCFVCFHVDNQMTWTQGFNADNKAFDILPPKLGPGEYIIDLPGQGRLRYMRSTLEARARDVEGAEEVREN